MQHMGGPAASHATSETLYAAWLVKSQALKEASGSVCVPVGSLSAGLSRHRALLFKTMSDAVQIPCRLLRGKFYTGGDSLQHICVWIWI